MKHFLLMIAMVVLVGCGPSIHQDAMSANIEAVKQHLAKGVNVDSKDENG